MRLCVVDGAGGATTGEASGPRENRRNKRFNVAMIVRARAISGIEMGSTAGSDSDARYCATRYSAAGVDGDSTRYLFGPPKDHDERFGGHARSTIAPEHDFIRALANGRRYLRKRLLGEMMK